MRNIVTDKWLYHSSLLVVVFYFYLFIYLLQLFYIADVVIIHKPILATNNICRRLKKNP
jgi:hypothetical protein